MRNLRKRILAIVMAAVLALGSISYPGTAVTSQAADGDNVTLTDESQLGNYNDDLAYQRVGVHDPSVIQDPDTGRYYLFGSHCAWVWSDDLKNWKNFTNNITEASAVTIFKDEIAWCQKANSKYTVTGNMWAPDVVWSEPMQKWCMYMSINGPDWNSTISLLTADKLDGDWTYVGPVIQSGMSKGYGVTFDFTKVTGETSVPARYTDNVSRGGNPTLEAHAIDACVVYDDNGDLWMTYGSWSGGISMIKLDPKTGLRDYNTKYKDTNNAVGEDGLISDPYTGYKIAGGTAVSGEGSYIQKIGEYYFLFLSYGGYAPEGGYNMRIFRSKDIKGPYKDVLGKDARTVVNSKAGDTTGTTGMRLISYYKWNFEDYGYTAQGHNSAIVDPESNKAFVIYHNKFNDGTAAHEVRNHQLLMNEDGWIMAAPFEYAGETMSAKGYSQELFTGDYGIMFQKANVNSAKLECATEQNIRLEAGTEVKDDAGKATGYIGKISGAYEGTWTTTADSPYVSLKIGDVTYKGVFCEGTIDETNVGVMTFTAIGDTNQECLWGYKVKDPTQAIRMTIEKQIHLPETVVANLKLPTVGVGGSQITWKSNNNVISDDGVVSRLRGNVTAEMTATISCGGKQYSKKYTFTVAGKSKLSKQVEIPIKTFYKDEELDMSALKQGQCPSFVNPYYYTTENISNGVVISFDVTRTATSDRLSNIISFNNKLAKLYFTGGSYLGYNDFGDPLHFFDANLKTGYEAGTDFLETGKKVTIKLEITSKGVTVYKNGEVAYSTATLKAGSTPGSYSANDPETTVLSWIKKAPELNFGSGNFWNDLIFKGKISNIVCSYIQPAVASFDGIYAQDYEGVSDINSVWNLLDDRHSLSLGNDETHNQFFLFKITSSVSANGSAYSAFDEDTAWSDEYLMEFDLGLKAGNIHSRSESQFAITTTTDFPKNASISPADCVFSLSMPSITDTSFGSAGQAITCAIPTEWQVNGNSGNIVTLPVADEVGNGWVHVSLLANKTTGKGTLKISSGESSLYSAEITIPQQNPTGFFVLNGRGTGIVKLDNVVIRDPNQVPDTNPDPDDFELPSVDATQYRSNLALNAISLPNGWKWKQPDTKLNAGTQNYTIVYEETGEEFEIPVTVNKATDPSYALPEALSGVEGTSLSAIALPENWTWKNPSEVLVKDKMNYAAIFTHPSGNYEPLEVSVPVSVKLDNNNNSGDGGNNGTGTGNGTGSGTGNGDGTAGGQKASIVLNKNQVTLYTGKASKSVVVTANVTGASQNVSWSSSNTKVATVSNGTIKAVKKGTATITATANGVSATVKVTVKNPSIKVKKGKKSVSKVSVKRKKSVKLMVTVSPSKSGMSLAKISAKNKKIAKVTFKKGKLTIKGKKKGKFTLKIKSGKATKSLKVTVK